MKAVVAAAFAALCLAPAAAAGPAGSGLAHTEQVAREAAASIVVSRGDGACLEQVARATEAWPNLRRVQVGDSALRLTFRSPGEAAAAAPGVQELVAAACSSRQEAETKPSPQKAPAKGA